MKYILAVLLVMPLMVNAEAPQTVNFGFEIADSNSMPLTGSGARNDMIQVGPFNQTVYLQAIECDISMIPVYETDPPAATPYTSGFAQLLVQASLQFPGQILSAVEGFYSNQQVNWSPGPIPNGGLFSKILKVVYPSQAYMSLPYTPLRGMQLPQGGYILFTISYQSPLINSDIEIQGNIQYTLSP